MKIEIDIPTDRLPEVLDAWAVELRQFAGLPPNADLWDPAVPDTKRSDLLKAFFQNRFRDDIHAAVLEHLRQETLRTALDDVAVPDLGADDPTPDLSEITTMVSSLPPAPGV